MKPILEAPFLVEMIRTTTNMYNHGWDERNGGNISLLLDAKEVAQYLDVRHVIRTIRPGRFSACRASRTAFQILTKWCSCMTVPPTRFAFAPVPSEAIRIMTFPQLSAISEK